MTLIEPHEVGLTWHQRHQRGTSDTQTAYHHKHSVLHSVIRFKANKGYATVTTCWIILISLERLQSNFHNAIS